MVAVGVVWGQQSPSLFCSGQPWPPGANSEPPKPRHQGQVWGPGGHRWCPGGLGAHRASSGPSPRTSPCVGFRPSMSAPPLGPCLSLGTAGPPLEGHLGPRGADKGAPSLSSSACAAREDRPAPGGCRSSAATGRTPLSHGHPLPPACPLLRLPQACPSPAAPPLAAWPRVWATLTHQAAFLAEALCHGFS